MSLAPTPQGKGKAEEEEGQGDERGQEQDQPQELTVHVKVKAKEEPKVAAVVLASIAAVPVAMESGRDYREYDLPTDTDDSSVGQSSPLDSECRTI